MASEFTVKRVDPSFAGGAPQFTEDPDYNGAGYLYYNTTERKLRVNIGNRWKGLKEQSTYFTNGLIANVDWSVNGNGNETIGNYGTAGIGGGGTLQSTPFQYQEFASGEAFVINGDTLASDYVTVEVFYKPSPGASSSGQPIIFNKENCWEMARSGGTSPTTVRWAVYANNQSWFWDDAGFTVNDNQWYQIVLVYDGSTVRTYRNGLLTDNYAYPAGGVLANQTSCYAKLAGRTCDTTSASAPCPGGYAYFRVYNIALGQAQITQNWQYCKNRYGV